MGKINTGEEKRKSIQEIKEKKYFRELFKAMKSIRYNRFIINSKKKKKLMENDIE